MAFVVKLTEEETEGLRRLAELEHRSMHEVAKLAINERVAGASRRKVLDAMFDDVAEADAELLRRLAQ